jgi:hypothetical protein
MTFVARMSPTRHTREGGYPVRRAFSVNHYCPLEYWIIRPSAQLRTRRMMTAEWLAAARAYRLTLKNSISSVAASVSPTAE